MKYSEFIFNAVKAAADFGDPSVNYASFLLGNLNADEDYSGYLDKAYHEANAFFQRVSSLGKLSTRIAEFEPVGDSAAELIMEDKDFLKPVAVFQYRDNANRQYNNLPFKKVGNRVYVLGAYSPHRKIYVQYWRKVRILGKNDIAWISTSDNVNFYVFPDDTPYNEATALQVADERQIDLEKYGLFDELLYIGIDWIKGRLNEDRSLGHSQETEAESRLNDFDNGEFIFAQVSGGKVKL